MAGTKYGARLARDTMIKKYGSKKAYLEFMANIGQKGGKAPTTGGFYADRELARTAGAKGGSISRRRDSNGY